MRLALVVLKVIAGLGVNVDAVDAPEVLDTRCRQHRRQARGFDRACGGHVEEAAKVLRVVEQQSVGDVEARELLPRVGLVGADDLEGMGGRVLIHCNRLGGVSIGRGGRGGERTVVSDTRTGAVRVAHK